MRKLCSNDGIKIELCASMEKYFRPGSEIMETNYAGIFMLDSMMHAPTGVMWNNGPFFRSNRKDEGVLFNFCPWCGSDLEKNWREPVKETKDREIAEAQKAS